jgi:hypothetical protein
MSTMRRPLDRDAELEPELAEDRRTPGRPEGASSELNPLLRGTPLADAKLPYPDDDADQLASARGIVIWVLISAAALSALLIFLIGW